VSNKIAIVIPLYNEEHRFNFGYFQSIGKKYSQDVDFVLVDDGSSDRTSEIAHKISAQFSNFRILELGENLGKAEAIRIGFRYILQSQTKYRGLGFMDSDGAFDLADLTNSINLFDLKCMNDSYEAIFMSRLAISGRNIERNTLRHFFGRVVSRIIKCGLPNSPWDTQAGLKIFKSTEEFSRTIQVPFRTRWLFEVEILQRVFVSRREVLRIWEEPLHNWVDVKGSKIGIAQFVNIASSVLTIAAINVIQIAPIRIRRSRSVQ
jgi:glycosyltransferase involved in cell wall biosynthesis